MSRKWKRMVRKNAKAVNEYRLKQGIAPVSESDKPEVYKGRSTVLPLFLVGVSVFLFINFNKTGQDNMYWFTTVSYFLLALFIYFIRRPYLKVRKSSLSKMGFAREHMVNAENIKQIIVKPGHVLIEMNSKMRWGYSKFFNRFDVDAIAAKLKSFSEQNHITFVDETIKK
jgi:hypothetical protein